MPGLSGFDVLERVGSPQPLVIFTTAHPQYALQAFKVDSIDYLVKPVEEAALDRALAKLADVAEVTYFYARDKLTFAVTGSKHHALDMSLAELEERLPPHGWIRIHRSTLLNIDAVKELRSGLGGRLSLPEGWNGTARGERPCGRGEDPTGFAAGA